MSYQVLARKWRPHNFPEMVGQNHVLRALANALENNRLHHAYLFTGTRGVGKTTIARILAKSLNCETKGVSAYPCGECNACREIDAGRFVDLIEVDAASRTKVEDTRDLLENVQYAPTRGRYKVYLIDEVHMLSTHSFNALLKTLEEPPPHVKFLLATTDPQKLPPTILSRCLQFSLKRLSLEQITTHLAKIVATEQIDHEAASLKLLAQAADGSLRDALSLLDQAIAYGAGKLLTTDVSTMLGTLDYEVVLNLVRALATNNATEVLQQVASLAESNPDFNSILSELLSLLQKIALAQFVPQAIDQHDELGQEILALAQQMLPEEVQLFYQIGLIGRRDLPLSPEPRGGFEMIMLRMLVFRPQESDLRAPRAPERSQPAETPRNYTASPAPHLAASSHAHHVPVVSSQPVTTPTSTNAEWAQIVSNFPIRGLAKELIAHCEFKQLEGNIFYLTLSDAHKTLCSSRAQQVINEHLQQHYQKTCRIELVQEKSPPPPPVISTTFDNNGGNNTSATQPQETPQQFAQSQAQRDPFVIELQEVFQAELNKITPKVVGMKSVRGDIAKNI
jgi:DNA polymerase III subunit gamma/tau